jgi:tetratricopeptide (TPR) repeat protein
MDTPKPKPGKSGNATVVTGNKSQSGKMMSGAQVKGGVAAQNAPTSPPPPKRVPPLFRPIDWFVLIFCFAAIWTVYLLTLAPDLTLEDSGELTTASFYAGIPHPPGYPFWSIYSWFWTWILPMGSVTWRVEVGESFAAALACGLVGFMVSRGSSMLIEGIKDLNESINRQWENGICIVSGITAGLLLGFDNFMWKESVVINRISVFDVPWLMMVALCLLRWIYAPHQRRYLYIAMFFFGICATIHQTMLVAAMGIEVVVALAHPRYGRTFFLGNSVIFLSSLILMRSETIPALNGLAPTLLVMFWGVGIASVALYIWLVILTKADLTVIWRDCSLAGVFLFVSAAPGSGGFCIFLSFVSMVAFCVLAYNSWKRDLGWLVVIACGLLWVLGVSFYFYEPISGMAVPPMQWGYPRTVEGFFHALSRGQYEKANPTDVLHDPFRFVLQLGMLISGLANSFSWVNLFVALLPFLFITKLQKRERAWIIGLAAIYFCVGFLLMILMNTTPDRQSAEENKVFFTAGHAVISIFIGYGLALLAAFMATHYASFRVMGLTLGSLALVLAAVVLFDNVSTTFYGGAGLLNYNQILLLFLSMAGAFVLAALAVQLYLKAKPVALAAGASPAGNRPAAKPGAAGPTPDDRMWFQGFSIGSGVFLAAALFLAFFVGERISIAKVVGSLPRIFAPGQYSLPVIGGLLVVIAVVGFVSMVFVYRNRAPVLITLSLFLLLPLYSGLTHWAKAEERNHWYGYWFGHDMFTPPFEGPDGNLSYDPKLREQMMKDPKKGDLVYPEMTRHTILFGGTDPGRFNPTYMIFCESFVPPNCKPMDPLFDRRDVYLITQNALADGTYLDYLRSQYFRSAQQDPYFFSELVKYLAGLAHMQNNGLVQWTAGIAEKVLDVPFTRLGAKIEARRRAEGVYPPNEIYIPSPEDSAKCFQDYTRDVAQREQEGRLMPGEDVQVDPSGRVQVSGQVAVMMINGLLCRVIFDKNPTNEFYVEESFPLEWMYPYETPFGIIMKINREPNVAMPEDALRRDHAFWKKYSERFIGDWIDYKTPVGDICTNFVEKVFLQNDYSTFKGDHKFLRDEDAQKAFSKLRSSQAGMYAWRLRLLIPFAQSHEPEEYAVYRPKSDAEIQQLYQEADFAFKQAFAFCPYSPEAAVRYVNFLFQFQRFDDALLVAKTWKKLDPYNSQASDLIDQIEKIKEQIGANSQAMATLQQMDTEAHEHPTNIQNLMTVASSYVQMGQTNLAVALFDQALTNSAISYNAVAAIAQFFNQLGPAYLPHLEAALQKLTMVAPDQPEAFYDLAAMEAVLGKNESALTNLRTAMDLNAKRLKSNPNASNLILTNRIDARFDRLRNLPEFQKIVPPN